MRRIYLDGNAGARLRPSAAEALSLVSEVQNPSSVHHAGRGARALLRNARREILRLLGVPQTSAEYRLIFTSGGTEACNLMIRGFLGPLPILGKFPGRIVSSSIEHPAVLETLDELRSCGWQVVLVDPRRDGSIDPDEFVAAAARDTALVALMAANNETGVIQPIEEVSRKLRLEGYRGPIVCDFIQMFGKGTADAAARLFDAGVDAISLSAHKVGAPAGTGALVVHSGAHSSCLLLHPLLRGGFQEDGHRPGTENLFGAVAWGLVCRDANRVQAGEAARVSALRDELWRELAEIEDVERIGTDESARILPNTLMVRFQGCRGDDLVVALDVAGVMVSTGSACASGKQGVSHVIEAMGYVPEQAREVLRFSLDWATSEDDIRSAAECVRTVVQRARRASSESAIAELLSAQRAPGREANDSSRNV